MRPEKLNDLFLKYLTPSRRLEFIIERLQDIKDLLEEVSYEIAYDGLDPSL
jgi:hypothetical protein